MIQDIFTYAILIFAFGAAALNILRFLNLVGRKNGSSNKCAGCSTGVK